MATFFVFEVDKLEIGATPFLIVLQIEQIYSMEIDF